MKILKISNIRIKELKIKSKSSGLDFVEALRFQVCLNEQVVIYYMKSEKRLIVNIELEV